MSSGALLRRGQAAMSIRRARIPIAPRSEALAQRGICGSLSVMAAPATEIRKKVSAAKRDVPPVWCGENALVRREETKLIDVKVLRDQRRQYRVFWASRMT